MQWYDIEVDGRQTVKFADNIYLPLLRSPSLSPTEEEPLIEKKLGGILRRGEWAWLARNSLLQIVSLRNGQAISTYEFCESQGYVNCCIKHVEELFPNDPNIIVVAVILENFHVPSGGGSFVVLYSIEMGSVLSTIELSLHATCARFLDAKACKRTLLQNFDGCLAIGSEEGVIVLLDMNMTKLNRLELQVSDGAFNRSHIVDYSLPLTDIHRNYRQCQQDGITFGLQLEVIESPCSIQCLQSIDLIMGLAVGLEDGRLALYDLTELQIFYIARPTPEIAMSPLVKIDYLEPPDDPRPCLYLWALHENGENLHAILHNLMYEKRVMEEQINEDDGQHYFETFLASNVRLQLPLEATKSEALACQAISSLCCNGEDDSNCLCFISWYSVLEEKNKLLIFDLNQWYKEEMPFALEYGQQPSYLAGYILNGECNGLHTYIHSQSITHFNSMQRFEEHFYPNSLSFECSLLHTEGSRRYCWEGAQNRLINLLRVSNASIFLEPNDCFNEILRTRLLPQFTEMNLNSTFSKQAKYEIMLSTALENNCVSLLKDCAKSWIDGSFMGDFAVSTGLSLSTLTDWIWKRATDIKARCNDLCKGLFEFGGYPLDHREQKELCFITRQLKLLQDILADTLTIARKQIPEKVFSSLENNYNTLRMATNYQELLLWLLNIGLLPEASPFSSQVNSQHDLVPYPYNELKDFYKKKRSYFSKINENFISSKTGSCRLLYIDAFIDHTCKGNALREFWLENDGDGLYPPTSIEAMLRVMLVPELDYENKYAILLYFFLDMNMAIDEEAYKGVVANFIKFPSVFKLSAALIKTVQSFWNLDHDQFLPAVEEFISPFNKMQSYPQWLVELLIESLLTQNSANLALRILESQPSLISPMLKLKTLLANQLISEAFHFVRSKNDEHLLEIFFTCCLCNGQFGIIRDLALSENEGIILQNILKRSKAPGAESLHFVYLLQKSKYIEAVSYMDELSAKPKSIRNSLNHHNMGAAHMETPNMVLSAFNTTMTPVTQGLTDVYFRIKNKIKKKDVDNKSPVPLSCQLIKQNANSLLGGIYHSSALSAHFATYYWGEMEEEQRRNGAKHLLSSNNAPFLRRPQNETNYFDFLDKKNVSYPQAYKVREKRNLVESELLLNDEDQLEKQKLENQMNPKKKRRLIGQEIVDDLTQFMKLNKPKSLQLSASDFKFSEKPSESNREEQEQQQQESLKSMDILTRPLKIKHFQKNQEDHQRDSPTEIHGILKSNTLVEGAVPGAPEEEKYLRFRLPSIDLNDSMVEKEKENEEDEVEEMVVDKECESSKPDNGLITSNKVTRSVSIDSNKSSVSSSNASEENFYSPLSSHNNSKLDTSTLSRCSYTSGPKPRRPITRLSTEIEKELEIRKSAEKEIEKPDSLAVEPEESREKKTEATKNLSKGESSMEPSKEEYDTAHDSSNFVLNIFSRKHLASISGNLETSENITNPSAYVTAFDKLSHVTTKTDHVISKASSGFGSISASSTLTSGSQFLPKVSSSKVGTTPLEKSEGKKSSSTEKSSQCITVQGSYESNVFAIPSKPAKANIISQKSSEDPRRSNSPEKLAECSTVLGSFDYTSSVGSNNIFAMPSEVAHVAKPTEEQKKHMLDTTLGMSTYDFSVLDSTSVQQSKSSLMVTANEFSERKDETSKSPLSIVATAKDKEDLKKKEEEDESGKSVGSSEFQKDQEQPMEITEDEVKEENVADVIDKNDESSNESEAKPKRAIGDLLDSSDDDDCIVLSSSSSYIDDNDYGRPFELRESDNECALKGEHGDISSERSFDTGEYEGYADEMGDDDDDDNEDEDGDGDEEDEAPDNEESESMDPSDRGVVDDSNQISDIVEVIDDSSEATNTEQNMVYPDESNSVDVKLLDDSSSSNSNKESEQIVSTTITDTKTTKTSKEIGKQEMENMEANIKTTTFNISEIKSGDISIPNPSTEMQASTAKELEEKNSELPLNTTENKEVLESDSAKLEKEDFKSMKDDRSSDSMQSPKVEEESTEVIRDSEDIVDTSKTLETTEEEQITLRIEDGDSMDVPEEKEISNSEKVNEEEDAKVAETISKGKRTRRISVTLDSAVASPRRSTRGTSVPPLDLQQSAVVSSPRRTTRGISMPPADIETKTSTRRSVRATSVTPADVESPSIAVVKSQAASSSSSRRSIRGTSVPPIEVGDVVASPRLRTTRGISVPPQSVAESESTPGTTPSRRRSLRASSLQPKYKMDEESAIENEGTPSKREKLKDSEDPDTETRTKRGTSVPPPSGKVSTRRRSIMLDAINEDATAPLDSPSAHTRFRSRLNSNDSELDTSVVSNDQPPPTTQLKRSRRLSLSGSAAELPLTPKLTRRNSVSSQQEVTGILTPTRALKGRSILSVPEEGESKESSETPRKKAVKRKVSTDENPEEKNREPEDEGESESSKKRSSPKTAEESESTYSSSRRLTRTQLAMMEKSNILTQSSDMDNLSKDDSPTNSKRSTRGRPRSTANASHESDDAESVSSKRSNTSSATGTKRRITRKSARDKEDHEDDKVSVASSMGSDKNIRSRRSKDKGSPSSVLSAIPEDVPVESKKRGRPSTKH
ncbi:AT hook containing transcription factor 1 homolog isoform X2 [Haematobia irritans]|uniref:AT hook containing transcription factor 1 homolog isoform X2 n=1 Tax=Haematobia irritans TaxID=7368 RepID=UPI003F507D69